MTEAWACRRVQCGVLLRGRAGGGQAVAQDTAAGRDVRQGHHLPATLPDSNALTGSRQCPEWGHIQCLAET